MNDGDEFLVRLVMRLSGGKVSTPEGARRVLLFIAGIAFLASLAIFMDSGSGTQNPLRQLESARNHVSVKHTPYAR